MGNIIKNMKEVWEESIFKDFRIDNKKDEGDWELLYKDQFRSGVNLPNAKTVYPKGPDYFFRYISKEKNTTDKNTLGEALESWREYYTNTSGGIKEMTVIESWKK